MGAGGEGGVMALLTMDFCFFRMRTLTLRPKREMRRPPEPWKLMTRRMRMNLSATRTTLRALYKMPHTQRTSNRGRRRGKGAPEGESTGQPPLFPLSLWACTLLPAGAVQRGRENRGGDVSRDEREPPGTLTRGHGGEGNTSYGGASSRK